MAEQDDLRRRAEELSQREGGLLPEELGGLSPEEAQRVLHELRVHKFELEVQNEELRRAQVELGTAWARYSDLYDFAPVGYCTLDEHGVVQEANLTAAKLLNVPRGALVKQSLTGYILMEDRDIYYSRCKQLFEIGEPQDFDIRMLKKDGAGFWAHVEATAVRDSERACLCRLVLSDITARKAQQDAQALVTHLILRINMPGELRDCLADLTALLQEWSRCEAVGIRLRAGDDFPYYESRGFPSRFIQLENHLCAFDRDGVMLRDDAGCPVLECMCGNVLRGHFDPSKPFFTARGSFWSNSTTGLLAGTTEADRQGHTRNRCNAEGYESVALIPLRTGDHILGLLQFNDPRPDRFTPDLIFSLENMAGSLAIALAQRQAEEVLRVKTEMLDLTGRMAKVGGWEFDPVTLKGTWTDEVARIHDLDPRDATSVEIGLSFYTPESRQRIEAALAEALGSGKPYDLELEMISAKGICKSVRTICHPVVDERGRVVKVQGIFQDITERKQAEEALAKLRDQFQQSQKLESLGSLAGGVAHDMNNVLGAILGLASAHLEIQPFDSPAHRAFDTIAQAAIRGGKMVKSLLSLARQSPAEDRVLDVNAILREEIGLLERTTLSKIRLKLDLDPELRAIRGDGSALSHAFMNLCVNAVDAMPENGMLTLRTQNSGKDWVEVTVEDTGCGMPPEILEKALDPFFTTKEQGKGTGLGLSLAYSAVKAHGGQLDISSEQGRGTRVNMRFPACEAQSQEMEPSNESVGEPPQGKLNVLLVDDDELIQSSVIAILEMLGHGVTGVSSGEEALAALDRGLKPDVVILDMNMPGLGGPETLPRIRAAQPNLPVLLATGRVDQAALDLVAVHPRVTLLPKPFSLKELRQRLETLP